MSILKSLAEHTRNLVSQENRGYGHNLPPEPSAPPIIESNPSTDSQHEMASNPSKPHLTFINNHEWEGLYIDGKLAMEDNELNLAEVLRKLGFEVEEIQADEVLLSATGKLPENVEDVIPHVY